MGALVFGAEGETLFSATKQSTGAFSQSVSLQLPSWSSFLVSLLYEITKDRRSGLLLFGAEGETRTLAPVTRPTPLAGAPRHQLEYFCV